MHISFAYPQQIFHTHIISPRGKWMNLENLIGQVMVSAVGKTFKIVDVEDNDDIEDIIIRTNNKQIYNLYIAFTNNYLKFDNKNLNKEFKQFIKTNRSYKE